MNNCGPGGMIEYYGVRPDVGVIPDVEDLRRGGDTHVKCAIALLDDKMTNDTQWPFHEGAIK